MKLKNGEIILLEEIASHDENLLEKYLAEQPLSDAEIKNAIRDGCIKNVFIPTLCGSAFKNKGVQRLLDAVNDFLPSPVDIGSISGFDPSNNDIELTRSPF